MGRLGSLSGCVGNFRAVLGASWEYLETSGTRFGVVLEASQSRVGGALERLGPSWGLGSVLEVSCAWISSPKKVRLRHAILDAIFQLLFSGHCLRKPISES